MSSSKPEVFIVESLDMDDEQKDRREGQRIADMLRLSGKKCHYYYLRSERELREMMNVFRDSEYRYLHISCHGDKGGLATTFDTDLDVGTFSNIINPYIRNRRVFLSACEATTKKLATKLLTDTGCYSVMGPSCPVQFNDAALFWATFYHLMFAENDQSMERSTIQKHGMTAAKVFGITVKLFALDKQKVKSFALG